MLLAKFLLRSPPPLTSSPSFSFFFFQNPKQPTKNNCEAKHYTLAPSQSPISAGYCSCQQVHIKHSGVFALGLMGLQIERKSRGRSLQGGKNSHCGRHRVGHRQSSAVIFAQHHCNPRETACSRAVCSCAKYLCSCPRNR